MKKNLFLAALAGVALVGCAKNEVAQVTDDSQREITFTTPVLALNTKADEIDGAIFPNTASFNVFAYYTEGDFSSTSFTLQKYMNDVTVEFDNSYDLTPNAGLGGWHSTDPYYWPKNNNSKLTFDAYYPSSLNFSSTAENGLSLSDYTAPYTYSNQNDVMYATRAYNKTYSDQTSETNANYDGVDIQFNHAMSVVKINVIAKNTTAANAIKVKSITLKLIAQKGSFAQTYTSNGTSLTASAWTVNYTDLVAYAAKTAATDYSSSTEITATGDQYGNNMIVLPQEFTTGKAENAEIEVVYYIKNGGASGPEVEQVYHFKLADTEHKVAGSGTQITAWEMGKRYTYNITFGVDEIYLAPEITGWDDVEVAGIEI